MGFIDLFRLPNINKDLEEYRATPGAVLLDVRTIQEFEYRRIPGSVNVPAETIDKVLNVIENKDTPIFSYCYSGGRSASAVKRLRKLGYTNVKNIGGISNYTGKVEMG